MSSLLPDGVVPPSVRRHLLRAVPRSLNRQVRLALQGRHGLQQRAHAVRMTLARLRLQRLRSDAGAESFRTVEDGGRTVLAQVVTSFRTDEVWGEQAARVADALAAHGVDHVFVSVDRYRRRVVAVPRPQRDAALAALRTELGPVGTQLAPVYGDATPRPRALDGRRPRFTNAYRVFQTLCTASGALVGGAETGCDLQLWREVLPGETSGTNREPLRAGTLVGERTGDALPETVEPGAGVVEAVVDGHLRPVAADLVRPHLLQVLEPVDVVYTWVDGSDPAWRARRDAALADEGRPLHALAANESRYTSHDELRYSLRSLEMYAPWVRRVFLVTDDQVPSWLVPEHPRLTVVSHRTLFGSAGRLPTFNSHAIEARLHHIDGLAENYLYLNDDVFFGRPVDPSLFVHDNGVSKIFLSSVKLAAGPVEATDLPITSAGKNNRDLLAEKFGRTTLHKYQHAPYSLTRSVMHELEQLFPEQIAATTASRFRSPTDLSVSASLGLSYGYLVGRAVPGRLRFLYLDIARAETPARLAALLARRDQDVFCLNDHDSHALTAEAQQDVVAGFLERYYPLPSTFER